MAHSQLDKLKVEFKQDLYMAVLHIVNRDSPLVPCSSGKLIILKPLDPGNYSPYKNESVFTFWVYRIKH